MESSINQPHPDDEADLFFGGGDEAEQPAEPSDTRSAEELEADAAAYRERTGEPASESTQSAERTVELREEQAARAANDAPPATAEPAPAAAPAEEQVEEAEAQADPTPAGNGGTTGSTTEPDGGNGGKQSGALSREYIVFHKLPLTKRVLEHLLKELDDRGGEPRHAFMEMHRAEARNARGAVSAAYAKHHQRLGEKCDLAAVSTKAFQEKHIEPEEVPAERRLKIT